MYAFEDESTEWFNYRYELPCNMSTASMAGYYNSSATVMESFGSTLELTPYFRVPKPGWNEYWSLNAFFAPTHNDAGVVNMAQVRGYHTVFFFRFYH